MKSTTTTIILSTISLALSFFSLGFSIGNLLGRKAERKKLEQEQTEYYAVLQEENLRFS